MEEIRESLKQSYDYLFKIGLAPLMKRDASMADADVTFEINHRGAARVARAAKAERFTGKSGSALELSVPEGLKVARLVVIGAGKTKGLEQKDLLKLGGIAMGKLPVSASEGIVFAELPGGALKVEQAADLAQGIALRAYAFDRYKTKRKDDEKPPAPPRTSAAVAGIATEVRR